MQQWELANNGGPPSPIININVGTVLGKSDSSWLGIGANPRQWQGPLTDWPEGTTQTKKCFERYDNVCLPNEYEVIDNYHNNNCKFNFEGHIDSNPDNNLAAGASYKTNNSQNGSNDVDRYSQITYIQIKEVTYFII